MNRVCRAAIVICLVALAGCASRDGGPRATLLEPDITLEQAQDNFELLHYNGPVTIRYRLTVGNPSGEDIVLERLDLSTVGPGAYTLVSKSGSLNTKIPSGKVVTLAFTAEATSRGDSGSVDEPVTVKGVAYFSGPGGRFTKSFVQSIRQVRDGKRGE